MSRTDDLAENALARAATDAERALNELKASAQPVGTHNVRHFVSHTGAAYDWSGTLTASSGQAYQRLRITATAPNMPVLFARLVPYIYVGSPPVWYRPSDAEADTQAGTTVFSVQEYEEVASISNTSTRQWNVLLRGAGGTPTSETVSFKCWVVSNDNVTVTVESVAL